MYVLHAVTLVDDDDDDGTLMSDVNTYNIHM